MKASVGVESAVSIFHTESKKLVRRAVPSRLSKDTTCVVKVCDSQTTVQATCPCESATMRSSALEFILSESDQRVVSLHPLFVRPSLVPSYLATSPSKVRPISAVRTGSRYKKKSLLHRIIPIERPYAHPAKSVGCEEHYMQRICQCHAITENVLVSAQPRQSEVRRRTKARQCINYAI